jgi:hypothetical protein
LLAGIDERLGRRVRAVKREEELHPIDAPSDINIGLDADRSDRDTFAEPVAQDNKEVLEVNAKPLKRAGIMVDEEAVQGASDRRGGGAEGRAAAFDLVAQPLCREWGEPEGWLAHPHASRDVVAVDRAVGGEILCGRVGARDRGCPLCAL